ncbi:MAG: T9SS type A sorting domain-containing protein [Bacteroidales bacterium]|nr:T9SS type A sorting domain-containing protein [Bacteroidales bacterium]
MKRFLLFFAVAIMSLSLSAQCPLTEAVDFNATDIHGTEINLFEILDGGQYVLIDFFYTTCGPCNQAVPFVVESYSAFGCNEFDVFYMEISPIDGDAALQTWCSTYGVEYPTIGTSGNGSSICSTYGITAYPTVILIAPNHDIVIQDLWPINNAQTIINALTAQGLEEHECGGTVDPTVDISIGEVTATSVEATFTPNDACPTYHILMSTEAEMQTWMVMFGKTLEELVQMWGIELHETATNVWTGQTPNTEYTVYALPVDAEGTFYELQTETATTLQLGGTGISIIDIAVQVIDETSVNTTATPNVETAEYHYGLITKEYFEEVGEEEAIRLIREDGYPLYAVDEWTWLNLIPNTYYYALGTGQNANGEWGETTLVDFYTSTVGIETSGEKLIQLFPNPANDYISVTGENISKITIYNAFGQKITEYETSDSSFDIPTRSYKNGIYFIRINDSYTERFVISH